MISGVRTLPATRATKMCPMVWSKIISTGTRESAQERTAANGSCLSTVWSRRIFRSRSKLVRRPETERSLPSSSDLRASSGVEVALGEGGFGAEKAHRGRAAEGGHRSSQSSAKEFAVAKSGFGQAREIVHWGPPYVVTAKQS
jgi:hypothetical protein